MYSEISCILSQNVLPKKNVLGVEDLTRDEIICIHDLARAFGKDPNHTKPNKYSMLNDKVVYLIFDQPSTRTAESFKTAVRSLGGIPQEMYLEKSSMMKGESLSDTLLMLEDKADLMNVLNTLVVFMRSGILFLQ